jgi:hypothetical protein
MPFSSAIGDQLANIVVTAANSTGGWGYYSNKSSRIEPTCWAILALVNGDTAWNEGQHHQFLVSRQRPDGLLSDSPELPVNLTWSAHAFLTLSVMKSTASANVCCGRLLGSLVKTAGVQLPNSRLFRQNNQLKGWSWIPGTFSWIEPTSWCLLALKQALRLSTGDLGESIASRIAHGEALLIDRACDTGGWNYGNPDAFGTSLLAHIPTTALGLIALQDKRHLPVVERSLAFLEEHWMKEQSGIALALSLLCFRIYARPTADVEEAMVRQWSRTKFLGNMATTAMACCALNEDSGALAALTVPL